MVYYSTSNGLMAKGPHSVISTLKLDGPKTATQISKKLGVTAMAVRQHLYALFNHKVVFFEERKNKAGRPSKYWKLTPSANYIFHDGHSDLAVGLIHAIRSIYGNRAIQQLLDIRIDSQKRIYGRILNGFTDISEKLNMLSRIRNEEGYMSRYSLDNNTKYTFTESHYPLFLAAEVCSGLWESDTEVFQHIFGPSIEIKRECHIMSGSCNSRYSLYFKDIN